MRKLVAILSLQLMVLSLSFSAKAGTFKRAKKIEITYCWTLEYVDPLCPRQVVELHPNGDAITVVGGQQFVGSYNKGKRQGVKFLEIDYSPMGVTYSGQETSRRVYEGTMQGPTHDGSWAGQLSNL